jgi:thioredoxin reductase
MSGDQQHDVVIVGGGPAGLSAAVVLGRMRVSALIIDAGQPRNAAAEHSHGFLTRDSAAPAELATIGRAEAVRYGADILVDAVTGLERTDGGFRIAVANHDAVTARRVIVATGTVDQVPELPGLREVWGSAAIHCPYCHGWENRDRGTVVWVVTEADVHKALMATQFTDRLTLVLEDPATARVSDEQRHQLEAAGARLVDGPVQELVLDGGTLSGVRTPGGVLPAEVFYTSPPVRPRDALLRGLDAAMRDLDTCEVQVVEVDEEGRTSVPGLWAAGNVADPSTQLIQAAAAGYTTAQAIFTEILAERLKAAEHA